MADESANPTRIYRWYDADGVLLYVGITAYLASRTATHMSQSAWTRWAVRMEIEDAPEGLAREDVEQMERNVIVAELPIFNVADAPGWWGRHEAYLLGKGVHLSNDVVARLMGAQARDRVARRIRDLQAELREVGPALTGIDAEVKCKELRDLVADPEVPLGDVDRAVLAYAVGVGLEKGTDRPTLPLRTTATGAGVSVKAVRLSFVRLAKAGLLVCEVKGRPSGKYAKVVRASAYRLPDPTVLAATVTSTREPEEQIMPTQERSHRRNRATFTVEDASPELLAELAAVLARHERDAKVHTNDRAEAVGNVVPLRKGRTA